MADETVKVEIVGDASSAQNAANSAAEALSASVGQMKSALGDLGDSGAQSIANLGEVFEDLRSKFAVGLQITGIGVAIEGLEALSGAFEKFGDYAIKIENTSEILGLTVGQFQGLQQAAEETGAPMDLVSRAVERLHQELFQAQSGSAEAIARLKELGLSTAEATSKSTNFNDVLLELKARLNDSATATDTMNGLVAIFGTRAALAAEALKKYSSEAVGVNALNDEQSKRLAETAVWWKELGKGIENTTAKLLYFLDAAKDAAVSGWNKPGVFDQFPAAGGQQQDQAQQQQQLAEVTITASHQVTQALLEDEKQQIAETRAGTAERLALVRQFYQDSLSFYGSQTVAPVRAAHEQMIALERELADRRKAFLDEWAAYYQNITNRNNAAVSEMSAHLAKELAAEQKQLADFFSAWDAYYQQSTLKNQASEAAADAKFQKAQNEMLKQRERDWKEFADSIGHAFSSAIEGMLTKSESFGQAMRSLFTSVLDAIINKLGSMVATWIENMILAKVTNQTSAASQIVSNAAVAATAAMASVAAIPFVGWAMAPEVGASTFAEAMAFESVASAAGGFDIPAGVNPVTQLHEREMVLPANLADAVRGMTGGGQGGGSGGTYHMNFPSMDPRSASQFFRTPGGRKALTEGIASAYRRGVKGTRR